VEGRPLDGRTLLAEQGRLGGRHLASLLAGENLAVVVVDRCVVVDHQDPMREDVGFAGHLASSVAASGSVSVNVAPMPGPGLSARSVPPSSRAARALECRPKPWPSARVVKP